MNHATDPTPLDVLQLQADAEMLARLEWMHNAAKAEMLAALEGRGDADQHRIRRIMHNAKSDVRAVWGDPFTNAAGPGESSIKAYKARRGAHDTVTLWSRFDQAMLRLADRAVRRRESH